MEQQPCEFDSVLGGQASPPATAVVLGGLDGLQQRLQSDQVDQRLKAVLDAPAYGQRGLELLIPALQDPAIAIQKNVYRLLQNRSESMIRVALSRYDAYQIFESLQVLRGHGGGVTAIAISNDGRSLVSAGRDGTLRVWDVAAREAWLTIRHPGFVYGIAISADRRTFTVKGKNQTIQAWDMRTGEAIDPDTRPTRTISSVTVSPTRHRTGQHLIMGSKNIIKIWNLRTGREVATLRGHTSLVTAVAIAPHQSLLVSGSEDKTIRIWGIPASY